jgi:hypothetical protein
MVLGKCALFVGGEQLVAVDRARDGLPAHALVDVLVLVWVSGFQMLVSALSSSDRANVIRALRSDEDAHERPTESRL